METEKVDSIRTGLWSQITCLHVTTYLVIALCLWGVPGADGLQCYNCRGITYFDPNDCFEPKFGKTIVQECRRGEVCEKKLQRIDIWNYVLERGCSSNCDGREYIWTHDFRVYCCKDDNLCNRAGAPLTSGFFLLGLCSMVFVVVKRMISS